jgi:hypothetical protein
MSEAASQKIDLRQSMPKTAKWVSDRRAEFGAEHVNACLRRSLQGEPGLFYAMEAGHVLGTPFPAEAPESRWQNFSICTGAGFAVFMQPPAAKGGEHGAH